MKLQGNVTQKNLDRGGHTLTDCPVYHTLKEIPGVTDVEVHTGYIGLRYNDRWYAIISPKIVEDFIVRWDRNLEICQPFSFELELWEE